MYNRDVVAADQKVKRNAKWHGYCTNWNTRRCLTASGAFVTSKKYTEQHAIRKLKDWKLSGAEYTVVHTLTDVRILLTVTRRRNVRAYAKYCILFVKHTHTRKLELKLQLKWNEIKKFCQLHAAVSLQRTAVKLANHIAYMLQSVSTRRTFVCRRRIQLLYCFRWSENDKQLKQSTQCRQTQSGVHLLGLRQSVPVCHPAIIPRVISTT